MNPKTEPATLSTGKKPRFALLLASGFGLGYLPKAPGTWGSLGGLTLAWSLRRPGLMHAIRLNIGEQIDGIAMEPWVVLNLLVILLVAVVGVWTSNRAARYLGQSDPPRVVIDEVSGQMIALLGVGWINVRVRDLAPNLPSLIGLTAPNWKYLLLGFILFRVFDIWKPFPARQAEALPGGWGIMADDWVAGVYAALGLWLTRALGL